MCGEQRLGAELGMSQPQHADGLKEAVLGHARVAKAATHTARRYTAPSLGRKRRGTYCGILWEEHVA